VTPRDMSVEVSAGIAATDLVQAHAERRFLVTQEELDAMARRERRVKATASPDSARRYLARRYRSVDDRAVASSARRTAEMLRERELAAVESEREDLRRAIAIQGRVNQRCLVAAATDD